MIVRIVLQSHTGPLSKRCLSFRRVSVSVNPRRKSCGRVLLEAASHVPGTWLGPLAFLDSPGTQEGGRIHRDAYRGVRAVKVPFGEIEYNS